MDPYFVVQGYDFKSYHGFLVFSGKDKEVAITKAKEAANKNTLTYVIDQFGQCIGKYGHGD